jgi:hypothetical protein
MSTTSTRRTKEEKELFLVKEFLEYKGIECINVANRPQGEPDVRVERLIGGRLRRIGIELTEFQCDNDGSESPKRRLVREWDEIVKIIKEEYLPKHPFLGQFSVHPWLDEANVPRKILRPQIAEQFVDFLVPRLEKIITRSKREEFCRARVDRNTSDFEGFPLIQKHFKRCVVWRAHDHPAGNIFWYCADAGCVGLSSDVLKQRIGDKANSSYETSGLDEMWLLIVASGETSADRVGDLGERDIEILTSPCLRSLAETSAFDRIVFWERVSGWDFSILDRLNSNA